MRKLYYPFGEAPEHMKALGEMTASFADLEGQISQLIWTLIGGDQEVGQIITAQLSFRRQIDLLGALFRHKLSNYAMVLELDQILTRAATVEQKRNILTHSQLMPGTGPQSLYRYKATAKSKGLKVHFGLLPAEEILQVTAEINEVAIELVRFQQKLKPPL